MSEEEIAKNKELITKWQDIILFSNKDTKPINERMYYNIANELEHAYKQCKNNNLNFDDVAWRIRKSYSM